MPVRPSNMNLSHSSNGSSIPNATGYFLSDDASYSDDSSDSDFSFEIEEEIVQKPKQKKLKDVSTEKQTNKDLSVRSYSSSQSKYSYSNVSREAQRSVKGLTLMERKAAFAYTAGSSRKRDDESIMSDDDFSISVASETDGLMSAVKSNASKSMGEVKDLGGGIRSIEQPRVNDKSGDLRDEASTISSKTAIQSLMEKLSSKGDASESKSRFSQPSFITATQKKTAKTRESIQSDSTTTSSKVESLKSKAAGSIDFAESIVKVYSDIEYGASTAASTSSLSGNHGRRFGTMTGQKMATLSSRRRSSKCKICCIVGFILVAAAGIVGALIALDVIFKDKAAPPDEPSEPAPETTVTTSSLPWYVDWDKFQCVMDCNGRPPCGGTKMNDDDRYQTLKDCCSEGMGDFIDEHWTVELCMEINGGVETVHPTYSPTNEEDETTAPTARSTPFPTTPSKELYYADFYNMKCIAENSGRKAGWERGYETVRECCGANFGGNLQKECLGEADSSTEKLVSLYYPDYGGRFCVEEDSSTKQSWEQGYETKDECCKVHFIWDKTGICFQGGEDIASTPISSSPSRKPTSPPIKTSPPTLRPTTLPPSRAPTRAPTRTPSSSPTASPVIPGSPSRSPVLSPTSSPSYFPSPLPTAFPSISVAPTSRPSSSPSATPTGPTPSPTGELEMFRTVLMKRSPLSSANLFVKDSAQYDALEWLVGNTLYESYPDDRKIQRWALCTFYHSLYGDDWALSDGWMSHTGALEHECTWHGITCTASGTVLSIDLKANTIYGHVPDEISLLADVEYLGLSENKIRSIPASLINLPKLKVLDMHKNRLNKIPEGNYGSSVLEEVYLSYNNIDTIPAGFFELRSINVLWLANNQISSTLTGFGKMTLLEELDLESNKFVGPIPEEMFGLVNLQVLYLYDNELAGQFPPGLSQMTSLTVLDLHSNHIGGQLPTEIGSFSKLSELHLGNNNFIGQIPSQLYNVASLTVLDISENYLNTTLAAELGNLNQLTKLDLHDNYKKKDNGKVDSFGVHGTIPDSIGSLTLLKELRLDNNYVQGTLPPTIGDLQSLEKLRLESNNFQGSIKAVSNVKNLQYLHLWSNYFSGTISNSIGQLSQVVELFFDDNEFTGSIPVEIGLLSNAKYISLGLNKLEGMIPSSFGMLPSLERLDLRGNNLSGTVPAEIGNIPSLERIRLEGNQFSGEIPKAVCKLDSLEVLSGNCAALADTTIVEETTVENSWSCNCCTTCEEF